MQISVEEQKKSNFLKIKTNKSCSCWWKWWSQQSRTRRVGNESQVILHGVLEKGN